VIIYGKSKLKSVKTSILKYLVLILGEIIYSRIHIGKKNILMIIIAIISLLVIPAINTDAKIDNDHYSNNFITSHTLLNLFKLIKAFESGKITFIPN
jgi:hypothetical protein